uniref:UPF0057 membrane protein n=1 Tax=Globodera pallida TaxID=36090 RepID=A0A183BLT4_GLOPA
MAIDAQQIIEFILCLILPPLAIFIHANSDCNVHVLISIVLCFLLFFPAVLHALCNCHNGGNNASGMVDEEAEGRAEAAKALAEGAKSDRATGRSEKMGKAQ